MLKRVKVSIDHNVGGLAPYHGALLHKGGVAKKQTVWDLITRVKLNENNKGVIIQFDDFTNYQEVIDICEMCKNSGIRVTLHSELGFNKLLNKLGEWTAKEKGYDLSFAEKMFASRDDIAEAIGGSVLDYYLGEYYVSNGKEIIRVADGKMFGEESEA
jgi:hypothetical protein